MAAADSLKSAVAIAVLVSAIELMAAGQAAVVHRHAEHRHPIADGCFGALAGTGACVRPQVNPLPSVNEIEAPSSPGPIVVYRDGVLALAADNASLGDILAGVQKSTGAMIDAPLLEDRLSVQILPGAPVRVIRDLLAGMQLNYVILGGTSDQDRLRYVFISRKSAVDTPTPVTRTVADASEREQKRFAEETGGDEGVWENGPQ